MNLRSLFRSAPSNILNGSCRDIVGRPRVAHNDALKWCASCLPESDCADKTALGPRARHLRFLECQARRRCDRTVANRRAASGTNTDIVLECLIDALFYRLEPVIRRIGAPLAQGHGTHQGKQLAHFTVGYPKAAE